MKNKGFTLIELIGTIVILSLLLLIIAPTITKSVKEGTKKADEQAKDNIILAAKNWASDNKEKITTPYTITIEDLQKEGYLDSNLKLPSTSSNITGSCVVISKENNKYKYEYKNLDCN